MQVKCASSLLLLILVFLKQVRIARLLHLCLRFTFWFHLRNTSFGIDGKALKTVAPLVQDSSSCLSLSLSHRRRRALCMF